MFSLDRASRPLPKKKTVVYLGFTDLKRKIMRTTERKLVRKMSHEVWRGVLICGKRRCLEADATVKMRMC